MMQQQELLTISQAYERLQALAVPLQEVETVSLMQAHRRVLATDLISPINVPPHDNSAMDGYAFQFPVGSLSVNPITLRVVGKTLAGSETGAECGLNECIQITTGAVMPHGCNTVVPSELVKVSADGRSITFDVSKLKAGDNRRLMGEDIQKES